MVRRLAVAALACGCTLIVDHELSKNGGNCGELTFSDGTPGSSGRTFHHGVTAPAFRGPAYPPPGRAAEGFGSTLAFVADGGLVLVGGVTGDSVFLRSEENWTPTFAVPTPGHLGPGGFGCSEVYAGTYDSLRDRTNFQIITGGCGDDTAFYDGGTFSGPPDPVGPALGWAGAPDGGGTMAVVFASRAQGCDEAFPISCFPPDGPPDGGTVSPGSGRRVDALADATGAPVWMVSSAGADVRIYDATFRGSKAVVSWSGPIAAIAADVGLAVRINSGQLDAQLFDSTGTARGSESHLDLGDPAAHSLEISRLSTGPILRVAWIGGDGRARVATLDATVATAPRLSTQAVVCGSQGATFVAPTSTTTAAVLVGDALYLRHVD